MGKLVFFVWFEGFIQEDEGFAVSSWSVSDNAVHGCYSIDLRTSSH